jgi:uncharacterized protein (UPF0333 family)
MLRGQVAVEFSFMVMLALIFFVVALVIVGFYIEKSASEQGVAALQDEGAKVQQELLLAAAVEDGYQRTLTLPATLGGLQYTVSNTPTMLTLTLHDGTVYNREIPQVAGSIVKGQNRLRNIGGALIIDQP